MKIPSIKAELFDINRQISVIKASYKAKDINGNNLVG